MGKVKIVTDSTQDFSPDYMEKHGVSIVPLTVHFGDEQFLDGIELRAGAFYEKLRTSPHHPRTSQPSPAAFQNVFSELTEDGSEVVAITLSSNLSGTFQSATIAKEELPHRKIHLIDSKQASAGHGLMALIASQMAQENCSAREIMEEMNRLIDNMVTLFCVDTLDYLARNGRIGKAQHVLGSMLKLKPILGLDKEGCVVSVDRVRGKGKVIPRILEILEEKIPQNTAIYAAITHAEAPEEAKELKEAVGSVYTYEKYFETEIGAIIGTHTGPGTTALFAAPAK